jgi:HSP20 family protein
MMETFMNLKSLIPVGRGNRDLADTANPLTTLQREIDRVFDSFSRGFPNFASTALTPSMNVAETDKEIEISAELPGLEEKDVQLNVADGVLTIKGEKKAEKEEKDKNYHLVERSYGLFSRSLRLPEGTDPDNIKASIAKGVLTVTVPKPAPAQTKKIEVKTAA